MVQPNLLHPVPVTLEQLDPAGIDPDDVERELVHGARSSAAKTITVNAQVKWLDTNMPQMQFGGVELKSKGYILVDNAEMVARGITLKRGDRITAIGAGGLAKTGLSLFLISEVPMGHYTDIGGAGLSRWHFNDRSPVQ